MAAELNERASVSVDGTQVATDVESFEHPVTLTEGTNEFTLTATDRVGNTRTRTLAGVLDTQPPPGPNGEVISVDVSGATATVTGDAGSVDGGASVEVTNTRTGETVTVQGTDTGAFTAEITAASGDELAVTRVDQAGNASDSINVATRPRATAPDNPAEVAPEPPARGSPPLAESAEFLYTGADPIQGGVAPGTIEDRRVAVLRGQVTDRQGEPLVGVTITIADHPELGRTQTRADGGFAMAVNGGGVLTVEYRKEGYLTVQRQVEPEWRDWAVVDEVAMTPLSDKVTTIDLTDDSTAFQVARGEGSDDDSGARQATLLFPSDTTAEITRADGSTEQLSQLDVRATEYTEGADGPEAMPGELPPASAYTYAVELSVNQMRERGVKQAGKGVRFSEPVPFYVDNFLDFPTGEVVPTGYYNGDAGEWVPYDDGRIVEILDEDAGRAVLDVTGDGDAATTDELEALGITAAERTRLAKLYEPGKSLWRVALDHLSTWDCNWPVRVPDDAEDPDVDEPETQDEDEPDDSSEEEDCPGCSISPQKQSVGESIDIAGTPYALHYSSDRVSGYARNSVTIPLTDGENPSSLTGVQVTVEIAGQRISKLFPAQTGLDYTYTWDGRDGFGRKMHNPAEAEITVSYRYPCVYGRGRGSGGSGSGGSAGSAQTAASFARPVAGGQSIGTRNRCLGARDQTTSVTLDSPHKRDAAVAGNWSLDAHHAYKALTGSLALGDGSRRADATRSTVKTPKWGKEWRTGADWRGDFQPGAVATAPDGAIYIANYNRSVIEKIAPDGTPSIFAGTMDCERDACFGHEGDGGTATDARIQNPADVAVGPDGALFMAMITGVVRRIAPDGTISTVAGGTNNHDCDRHRSPPCGPFDDEGGPAQGASLIDPEGIDVAPSGALYIADSGWERVFKVRPNGTITTFAGTDDCRYGPDCSGYRGDGG
ncbi:MAG: hypothetical protein BRD57_03690, partial [Proteobacteria bacterium SW_6_67_9]